MNNYSIKKKNLEKEYEINTGWIFSSVLENWRNYDRIFLEKDFQNALLSILGNRKIFQNKFSQSEIGYFKKITEIEYPRLIEEAKNSKNFPFPNYFLIYNTTDDLYPSIISFDENCIIDKDDYYFDLFFAIKITTIDLMQIDDFLKSHLVINFKRNKEAYFNFLNKLLLKYDTLLVTKYSILINDFIYKVKNKLQKKSNRIEYATLVDKPHTTEATIKMSQLKWKADNETEFVQLVYSLYEAGYITNDNHSITKMVEQMADIFGLSLGNNWQSNLSKSINKRNIDYVPEIFGRLSEGFNKYKEKLIAKKKKNSSK